MDTTWNHRVMNCPSENGGDPLLKFVEVYYEDGVIVGHSDAFFCGDDIEELRELLARLSRALDKPILEEPTDDPDAYS